MKSLISLRDLKAACGAGERWTDVDEKRGPMAVVTPEAVYALVLAVEAAQEVEKLRKAGTGYPAQVRLGDRLRRFS